MRRKKKPWPCPKCAKKTLRVGVSLFLDIPANMQGELSKKNLRSNQVRVTGAGWDRAYFYCENHKCGYSTHLTEVDNLRNTQSSLYRFLQEHGLADQALQFVRNERVPNPKGVAP